MFDFKFSTGFEESARLEWHETEYGGFNMHKQGYGNYRHFKNNIVNDLTSKK